MSRTEDQPIVCDCYGLVYYLKQCAYCPNQFFTRDPARDHCLGNNRKCYYKSYNKNNRSQIKMRQIKKAEGKVGKPD